MATWVTDASVHCHQVTFHHVASCFLFAGCPVQSSSLEPISWAPGPCDDSPQQVHAQKSKNGVFTRCSCNVLQVSLPHGRHNAFKRFGLWLQTAVSPNTLVGDGSPVANTVQLVCAGRLAGGRQDILFSVLRFFLVAHKALRSSGQAWLFHT